MELKGTVTLDEETLDALKEDIRKEVIEEIRKDGNYSNEIKIFLEDCNHEQYMRMITATIDSVINKTNPEEDLHFDSGRKAWDRILAIKALLKI